MRTAPSWIVHGRSSRAIGSPATSISASRQERAMVALTQTKEGRPIFASRRLGHVNLIVEELQRSTDFYNQVCGLALEFSEVGLKANFLGTGHTPHDVGMIECTHGEDRYGRDG